MSDELIPITGKITNAVRVKDLPDFAAGRLAGLREAAEAIVALIQAPYTGTRTDDFIDGWAQGANSTAERNRSAILALAEGKSDDAAQEP